MLITETEVYNIALNRNVGVGLLKPTQITTSEYSWFKNWVSPSFYNDVITTPTGYTEFIEDYIKPIIAWGTIYNNFDYLILNITDKGIIQMLVEGTANIISRDNKLDAKFEIKNTCYNLIKRMRDYANEQKENGNALFVNYADSELTPAHVTFMGGRRSNMIPF